MSFILEALRKSEQERQETIEPTIGYWHEQPKVKKTSKFLPLVISVGVLINLGAISFWVYQSSFSKNETSDSSHANYEIADQNRQVVGWNVGRDVERKVADRIPRGNMAVNKAGIMSSAPELQASIESSLPPTETLIGNAPGWEVVTPKLGRNGSLMPQSQLPDSKTAQDWISEGFDVVLPGSSSEVVGGSLPPEENILSFSQLPADIQSELPEFNFSSHLFTAKRSSRRIILNGKPLREGDIVSTHLLLERIENEAILLNYRGYIFRIPVRI